MPALDALLPRLNAAHTLACGVSVDSRFSHAAWGASLGGIRLPLLADFHPKGALAQHFGLYLDQAGISACATVLIDANGVLKHISVVDNQRDMSAVVAMCEDLDRSYGSSLPTVEAPAGLAPETTLYVRNNCIFSRNALYARANLGLSDTLPVFNISEDPAAAAKLEALGGKRQAPALESAGAVLYESKDIIGRLVSSCAFML